MNRISIKKDGQTLKDYILDHGSVTIGRARDNIIQLHDETISAHHARIITLFTASHIEDLGSTNGTFVNHRKILKHTLHVGDSITIGGTQIDFYTDDNSDPLAESANQSSSSASDAEVIGDSETSRISEEQIVNIDNNNGPDTEFNDEQAQQPLHSDAPSQVNGADHSKAARRNLFLAALFTAIVLVIVYLVL